MEPLTRASRCHAQLSAALVGGASWLSASTALGAIGVTITSPAPNAVATSSVEVQGMVSSTYQLASVQGQVQASGAPLTLSAGSYSGSISLASVPTGPQTLRVTATDQLGNTGSATVAFIHDLPPSLTVNAPLDGTVARPNLTLDVTCGDPDAYGCQSIRVYISSSGTCPDDVAPTQLAIGGTSVQQTLSLAAYEGQALPLCIVATDSLGVASYRLVNVYVDSTPRLVDVADTGGPILDVDAARILFAANGTVFVRDRSTGTDSQVGQGFAGNLLDGGVVLAGADGHVHVVTTQDLDLGPGTRPSGRGHFVTWVGQAPPGSQGIPCMLRDLTAGASVEISPPSSPTRAFLCVRAVPTSSGRALLYGQDVGASHGAWLYQNGSAQLVGLCGNDVSISGCDDIVTDDVDFAFGHYEGPGSTAFTYFVSTQGTYETLGVVSRSRPSYAVGGGWTAYCKDTGTTATIDQVWRRAPDGSTSQVSFFNAVSLVDAINPSGDVLYFNAGQRFLATSSGGPVPDVVSTALGSGLALGGAWYVVMGRSLFRVDMTASLDGGVEGGAVDGSAEGAADGAPPTEADAGPGASTTPASDASIAPGPNASGNQDQNGAGSGASSGGCGVGGRAPSHPWVPVTALMVVHGVLRRRRRSAAPSYRQARGPVATG